MVDLRSSAPVNVNIPEENADEERMRENRERMQKCGPGRPPKPKTPLPPSPATVLARRPHGRPPKILDATASAPPPPETISTTRSGKIRGPPPKAGERPPKLKPQNLHIPEQMQQAETMDNGAEIPEYEVWRQERMRKNRERMQKLGSFDLSQKLIKAPKPKAPVMFGPTHRRGRPRKIHDDTLPPPETTTITISTTRSGKIRGPPPKAGGSSPKVKSAPVADMQQGDAQGGEISRYEVCREERVRENPERMPKLGIFDLSQELINDPTPGGTTSGRGRPCKPKTPLPPVVALLPHRPRGRPRKFRDPPPAASLN